VAAQRTIWSALEVAARRSVGRYARLPRITRGHRWDRHPVVAKPPAVAQEVHSAAARQVMRLRMVVRVGTKVFGGVHVQKTKWRY
jgi:hypothetical protein